MSYHPVLGTGPLSPMTPTTAFAQAVDPYSQRFGPPGAIFAPSGWGPDFNIGMPMSYTHHIGYERTPIPGARRNIGTRGALYLKGGYAILLGERSGHVETTLLTEEGFSGFSFDERLTRMATVTDIELGGSWRAREHVIVSAGYMLQIWTDLTTNLKFTGNSNQFTLDGFVARISLQY